MFFEMLRNRVLIYSFVRVDQVICALVLLAFTVYACAKRKKGTPKRFLPLVGLFIAAGINALMQFVQDKPLTFTGMLPDSAADALMPWIPAICTVCFALAVCASTVLIKQHSIIDGFAAVAMCLPIELAVYREWYAARLKRRKQPPS